MKPRLSLKTSLLFVGIAIIIFFVIFVFFPNSNVNNQLSYVEAIPIPPSFSQSLQKIIDAQSTTLTDTKSSNRNVGLPVSLKIPKINVDATIEQLGLTPQGAMDVPKGPNDVAWFSLGPRPGEIGSAVIDGHFGWKNNIPAVFDNLNKLQKGDKIYVDNANGSTTSFIVSEIGIYDQNGDATNIFTSNDGKAHLNLITCEGVWNATTKSRPNRLVIFTDKE